VLAGVGIGFLPHYLAADHPELVEVLPPRAEWDVQLWLVTHVDLTRTPKVRAFLDLMNAPASGWRFT
jgi:DNA-binding transcriptional LysR family regulator